MQNYETLKISIQKRNDLNTETLKTARQRIKNSNLMKHQDDIKKIILTTESKINLFEDNSGINIKPMTATSLKTSDSLMNVTIDHVSPSESVVHDPKVSQTKADIATNSPFGSQDLGESVYNPSGHFHNLNRL